MGNWKALVVEDDPAIADFAEMILEKEGFSVRKAVDGADGLSQAFEWKPDLILLDLMMPGLHGLEVCEKVRAEAGMAGVRILITSSKCYASDFDEAKAAGADGYLTKPYGIAALTKKVLELVSAEGGAEPPAVVGPDAAVGGIETAESSREPSEAVVTETSDDKEVMVRFWGTRGSSPAPGPDTVRYGGNTSCTEVRFGDTLMVVDCGSGIRLLGDALAKEFGDRQIEGHLFVGHTHWDHIQGFPFFFPFYLKKNRFSVYSVHGAGKSLKTVFQGQMASDYFPVPLHNLACDLRFVEMEGPFDIGPVRVQYHFLNHPGVAIGFRFDGFGKSVAYISDHETHSRLNGDNELSLKQDRQLNDFLRGVDVLISEAQYTEEEYKIKKGWGHSTFKDVIERGLASEAKHLVLFHHDPTHTDKMMDGYLQECREAIHRVGSPLVCSAAQEGQVIRL